LTGPVSAHRHAKGQGYAHAEENCLLYHGVSKFDRTQGIVAKAALNDVEAQAARLTYTEVFGKWLCDMAEQDERLVGITPAMCEGSGMGNSPSVFRCAISMSASPSSTH